VCCVAVQGKGGARCEFIVNVNDDRTVTLESVKFADQFATILQSGEVGRYSRQLGSITRKFYVYCKVRDLLFTPSRVPSTDFN